MFSLFGKKKETIRVIDKVWMTESSRLKGLAGLASKDNMLVIACWFDETIEKVQQAMSEAGVASVPVYAAREIRFPLLEGRHLVMAEHHPLYQKEQEHFLGWKQKEITVHSALDEPLFERFGGERIIDMMKKLGMDESSMIEHSLVSQSIRNAQEKIEKQIQSEQTARSQREWMMHNLPR